MKRPPRWTTRSRPPTARHMTFSLVGGLALRAVVERSRGEMQRAAGSLARALELGGPGHFTRTFIDLGPPLTALLAELMHQGELAPGGRRVLMACRAASAGAGIDRPSRTESVVPLSAGRAATRLSRASSKR